MSQPPVQSTSPSQPASPRHRPVQLPVRRLCQALLRAAARLRSRPGPPQSVPGSVVVISPHPDDAELGCAGLIRQRRLDRVEVTVIIVTDGCASHPGHPVLTPDVLAKQRRAEAVSALQLLGVPPESIWFLGVPDGQLVRLDPPARAELVERLTVALGRATPSEIYTPHHHDGSSEHEAVFSLLNAATRGLDERPRVFEYPVWAWWSPRLLFGLLRASRCVWRLDASAHLHLKRRALACHQSQIEPCPPWTTSVLPNGFAESFVTGAEYFFET